MGRDAEQCIKALAESVYEQLTTGSIDNSKLRVTISKLRTLSMEHGLCSRADFVSCVLSHKSQIETLLKTTANLNPIASISALYDLLTSNIPLSRFVDKVLPSINTGGLGVSILESQYKRFLLNDWVDSIDKELSSPNFRETLFKIRTKSSLNEGQQKFAAFLKLVSRHVLESDLRELIGWMRIVVNHSEFDVDSFVRVRNDGDLDVEATFTELCLFANEISLAERPPFKLGSNNIVAFRKTGRGVPDFRYFEDGELKIGFASNSRDTSIEQNQFIRFTVEAAFYNAMISERLGDSNVLSIEEFRRGLEEIATDFNCCSDSYVWYKWLDVKNRSSREVMMSLNEFANSCLVNKSSNDSAKVKQFIASGGCDDQFSRSLFLLRLIAYKGNRINVDSVVSPTMTVEDLSLVLPSSSSPYYTVSPSPNLKSLLEDAAEMGNMLSECEAELINKVRDVSEADLYKCICAKAFSSMHGVIGSTYVSPEVVSGIMDRIEFKTGATTNVNATKSVEALLALCFTDNEQLWDEISEDLSDISVYGTGSGIPYKGMYKEERSNLLIALDNMLEVCSNELEYNPASFYSVVERFVGENAVFVMSKIEEGVLTKIRSRFDPSNIYNVYSGVKLASSETSELLKSISMKAKVLNSEFKFNRLYVEKPVCKSYSLK
ncbi:TPA: hypothetical protein I7730_14140 [Vibrio vulnificus]|uniref:Uncharacterized protein n=1 Tax=Vibrio vulnificus TaxID=672 RepID=A0A8H9TFP1_VIBVL|nr:hypothetical protein [Vibrio vulnificus]HAS8540926.1 hypothetical protein [Vibrio vulnificus]